MIVHVKLLIEPLLFKTMRLSRLHDSLVRGSRHSELGSTKVYSTVLKREVKTGDVIRSTDKLAFDNKGSYLYLHIIHPQHGRKNSLQCFRTTPPRNLMLLLDYLINLTTHPDLS